MKKFFFLLIIITLSACSSYQSVNIDILTPSVYLIPTSTQSITLVNNATEQAPTIGHDTYIKTANYGKAENPQKINSEYIKVDSTTTNALYSMYNQLNESMPFSSIDIGRRSATPTISNKNANQFLSHYETDALLVLEELIYLDNLTKVYYEYFEIEENEVEIITQSKWKLYYANQSQKNYSFTQIDTLFWQSANAKRADYVTEGVWNNAQRSATHISPHWQSVNRIYYSGSNLIYKEIDKNIKEQEWKDAAELWMTLYNGEKKESIKKAKLAFNMALFFEVQNDIETSIMWLGTALEIFLEKDAKEELSICSRYARVLLDRNKIQEKLDKYFSN